LAMGVPKFSCRTVLSTTKHRLQWVATLPPVFSWFIAWCTERVMVTSIFMPLFLLGYMQWVWHSVISRDFEEQQTSSNSKLEF
jgi:hypothetical protein